MGQHQWRASTVGYVTLFLVRFWSTFIRCFFYFFVELIVPPCYSVPIEKPLLVFAVFLPGLIFRDAFGQNAHLFSLALTQVRRRMILSA